MAPRTVWQTDGAKSMFLSGLLRASESIGKHLHGAQSAFWHTVAAKSMGLRDRGWFQGIQKVIPANSCSAINAFWGTFGGLWKHWGAFTSSPKLILAYSCVRVAAKPMVLRGRGCFQEGPKRDRWPTVAAKSLVLVRAKQRNLSVRGGQSSFWQTVAEKSMF